MKRFDFENEDGIETLYVGTARENTSFSWRIIEPMAEIVYKPHCSACGHLIDTSECEIEYQDSYTSYHGLLGVRQFTIIDPNKCPHCGAYFESIVIPPPKKRPDLYEPR